MKKFRCNGGTYEYVGEIYKPDDSGYATAICNADGGVIHWLDGFGKLVRTCNNIKMTEIVKSTYHVCYKYHGIWIISQGLYETLDDFYEDNIVFEYEACTAHLLKD